MSFQKGRVIGAGDPLGGQEHEAAPFGLAGGVEGRETDMLDQVQVVQIVHAGPAQLGIGKDEAGRMDEVEHDIHAGGEPHQRAGILRDVGLIKGEGDRHDLSTKVTKTGF